MKQTPIENPNDTAPSADEIRTALERVLASASFRRAERHAKFLRFVCETTLKGDSGKLSEYVIAHDVFERGKEYTPSEDSIVRRQAHALRQKLQEYYAGEGSDANVRIELPVGRYIPHFVRRPSAEGTEMREAEELTSLPVHPAWHWGVLATIALVTFAAGWMLARREHTAVRIPPVMEELWAPWMKNGGSALICFSSPLTTVVKQFDTPLAPDAQPVRIAVTGMPEKQLREALNLPSGGYLYLSPAITQSKVGEAVGSIPLMRFFTNAGIPALATQSRLMSWADFRAHNVILLGHDEANKWIDPILSKLPIRLGTNSTDKVRRIIDTTAEPSAVSEYYIRYPILKGQSTNDYALVSMIAGIDGKHELLIISGLNTEGTQMAMEFMSDPNAAESLLAALRKKAPNHQGPWHFQMVLRAEVRDKVPTRAEMVVLRVL
jgi:hypothetical protein